MEDMEGSRRIMSWIWAILTRPMELMFRFVWDFIGFGLIRADIRRAAITNPVQDVVEFISDYEAKFRTGHPVFYQGTYGQALSVPKKRLFCRTFMPNPDLVREMLFWGCSVRKPEGYRTSQALRESTYPFLALILLKNNRMTIAKRIEGETDPTVVLPRLPLRQQQDEAYLLSLKADQEKEKRKIEEIEKQKQIEVEKQRKIDEQAQRTENRLIQWKQYRSYKTLAEEKTSECQALQQKLNKLNILFEASSKQLNEMKKSEEALRLGTSKLRQKHEELKREYKELRNLHNVSIEEDNKPDIRTLQNQDVHQLMQNSQTPLGAAAGPSAGTETGTPTTTTPNTSIFRPKKDRRKFSPEESQKICDLILQNEWGWRTTSETVWKELVGSGALNQFWDGTPRNHTSLRGHFRKVIREDLEKQGGPTRFLADEEQLNVFKAQLQRN